MNTGTSSAASTSSADAKRRRRVVEERLRDAGRPRLARRFLPPEGRLGADEQPMRRLREVLVGLGPVFAGFGRYLSSRIDLLSRRDCSELGVIPDSGEAVEETDVAALIERELGAPPDQRFFSFDFTAHRVRLWTQQHDAWLSPGVPAVVTVVRPDAATRLAADAPLLPLLAPWFGLSEPALADAIADFVATLERRLNQVSQAHMLGQLGVVAASGGLFAAPGTYRSHCAPGVLTVDRLDGVPLDELVAGDEAIDRGLLSRRLAVTWLRQATAGQVVPFEFDARDVLIAGEHLILTGGSFEPQSSVDRARFLNYVNAVAADDPDTAASWLLADAVAEPDSAMEEEVRRRLRQAVPFRDGEWSGEDRLSEQLVVQWRMARQAGWRLHEHQLHVYRGIYALASVTNALAPDSDALLAALQEERLRAGLGTAQPFVDPRAIPATLDKLLQGMVNLPQKLDEVLTLAADGRLRVKLRLPRDEATRRTRNRTVSLVASLVVLTALAFGLRHLAFAQAPLVEQLGALLVMAVGLWLLVAAARL